jgi:AmmeMemoRadiSam system protein B/AmmeMemoRadiSam system protein A
MAPHAGYIYSGQIIADAFRQVADREYDVFVILGVKHTAGDFRGVSLADFESFRTPLGDVPVDREVTAALLGQCSDCVQQRDVHTGEHSIEVQIPFIQVLFPKARIVPAIVHPPDPELCTRFGKALASVLKGKKALIVISSDLSHYPAASDAVKADRKTLETIAGMDPGKISSVMRELDMENLRTRACGEAAILAGITAARILGATRAVIAGYANSGDMVEGDKSSAVGYGAVAFTSGDAPSDTRALERAAPARTASPLAMEEKKYLLELARKTLRQYLSTETLPLTGNLPPRLQFRQGAFVTLKKEGELRGCIGRIIPEDELGRTVAQMALHAALEDPRFEPVKLRELEKIDIEISVLTPLKPISNPEQIVVGRDGVLLIRDGRSAVFLPQVAPENNWSRTELLENLCRKGNFPAGCWKDKSRLEVFQAEVFSEKELDKGSSR